MIRNKNIVKTTGGKISAKVVTVAIDDKTGKTYYGISGYKYNPTRKLLSNNETEQHEILKTMINNFGESLTNYPIDNCGEFNAINNALFDKANITNLHIYSILISNNEYWAPCANCQGLYDNYVNFIE